MRANQAVACGSARARAGAPRAVHKVWALIRASWLAASSYKLGVVFSFGSLVVSVVPIFFVTRALQTTMADVISGQGDQYFAFLIVGLISLNVVSSTIYALAERLAERHVDRDPRGPARHADIGDRTARRALGLRGAVLGPAQRGDVDRGGGARRARRVDATRREPFRSSPWSCSRICPLPSSPPRWCSRSEPAGRCRSSSARFDVSRRRVLSHYCRSRGGSSRSPRSFR